MDINSLLQALGLTQVNPAQVMGLSATGGNLAQTPQQDYSRIQKLMEFLRQAQNYPQFQAAKGAISSTVNDVKRMAGAAGGDVLGGMGMMPMPQDFFNQILQGLQGPQG